MAELGWESCTHMLVSWPRAPPPARCPPRRSPPERRKSACWGLRGSRPEGRHPLEAGAAENLKALCLSPAPENAASPHLFFFLLENEPVDTRDRGKQSS